MTSPRASYVELTTDNDGSTEPSTTLSGRVWASTSNGVSWRATRVLWKSEDAGQERHRHAESKDIPTAVRDFLKQIGIVNYTVIKSEKE